eukprot:Unigene13631_Nuclearia_a/m.41247 Unigene13631_Nuclearia_a/g.41247  ORF Unigene13631_Nuclearia_a/g.41247 Unigene13631_Nuclearia_a/m.41247 type:complete len:247 (-) Unigene13631_Nuclearia_a:168-908(-)
MGAAPTAYDEHPALFRGFALAYGIVLAMALQSLRRAWGADPGRRWTVQKTLLALAACVCGARCVAYLGSIDWHLRYYVQHLFNAVVYWSFFSFHSVLLYFLHEFARFNSTGTGKFCSLSFLYPLDVLNRVKPMLIYVNSVVFLYTYFSLCMIHVQPDWAFLPVVIGSMLHAIIYFTLGANFWSYARLFYPRPIPLTGSTTVRVGTTMPVRASPRSTPVHDSRTSCVCGRPGGCRGSCRCACLRRPR